ncbi:glutamine-repressible protein product regulator [Mucor velutinosus]|uniref:Glutamine-repressible protein product regulator n=1 Tax=Mucor velutinosus TaxID=708070 RepID=A0AAN7I117_9FUNG|nr:glutamine-repressible protein product regulator [Mucor velutinosus]
MPPYFLLNDSNAVKRVILEQAEQIKCLKRQLEEYKRAASAETTSVSPSLVYNAPATPTPSTSIVSITSGSLVKVEFPSASSYTPESVVLPLQKTVLPPPKKAFKLSQLPSKQTFKKRIKAAIELDGYSQEVHFQHLIYQDSTLPSHTRNARWNFAFRFCSFFVFSGRKIFVNTLIHGNKQGNKRTSIDSFPGLHAFLKLKRINHTLLEKPLSDETVAHFTKSKHQLEIVKFLYAFCSLLYVFLPQEKRVFKVKSNINEFHLSANVETSDPQVKEEKEDKEIKEEANSNSEFMRSGSKAEDND